MPSRCSVNPVTDPETWDDLFSRVEHPHMTQSWAYGEARQVLRKVDTGRRIDAGGWRTRRLVFDRDGRPVAICQLFEKQVGGLCRASRLNRGPLFLTAEPDDDVVADVYGALRAGWKHLRGILILEPALADSPRNHRLLEKLGFRARPTPGACSDRVDLRPSEDELRGHLAPTWRNRLGKAERSGLQVAISNSQRDLEWLIERHVENMRDKSFSWPPPTLLRALYHEAADDLIILRAVLGEEAVGGMLVYRFGRGAEYYVGWMGTEGRKVNVGNFMFWQTMLELRRLGCEWLDLGGKRRGATEQFKNGMRGVEYRLLNEWIAF